MHLPPGFELGKGWARHGGIDAREFDAQENTPSGLQSRALAHRHKPGRGHGHARAFNTPRSPLADRVNGRLKEALSDLWEVPGWGHHKTSQDPKAPRDHVICVTDNLRAYPYCFARHPTTPDDASQYLQRA